MFCDVARKTDDYHTTTRGFTGLRSASGLS